MTNRKGFCEFRLTNSLSSWISSAYKYIHLICKFNCDTVTTSQPHTHTHTHGREKWQFAESFPSISCRPFCWAFSLSLSLSPFVSQPTLLAGRGPEGRQETEMKGQRRCVHTHTDRHETHTHIHTHTHTPSHTCVSVPKSAAWCDKAKMFVRKGIRKCHVISRKENLPKLSIQLTQTFSVNDSEIVGSYLQIYYVFSSWAFFVLIFVIRRKCDVWWIVHLLLLMNALHLSWVVFF